MAYCYMDDCVPTAKSFWSSPGLLGDRPKFCSKKPGFKEADFPSMGSHIFGTTLAGASKTIERTELAGITPQVKAD